MTASASRPLDHSDSSQDEEHEGLLGQTSHERAHSNNYSSRARSTGQDHTTDTQETHLDVHDDPSDDEQPLLPAYTPVDMRYPPSSSPPHQPPRQDHIHLNLNTPNGERQPDFDVDERRCRICLESDDDEDSESGKLISPCLCKGSSRYIHLGCLEQWRALSPRKASAFSCDTCHYHYSFSRPFMANILGHRWFLHTITTFMFLALCYTCSWSGHEVHAQGLWRWKGIFGRGGGEGPPPELGTLLGLDYLDIEWGLVMVAVFGLMYLMVFGCSALCSEDTDDREENRCNCSGDSCSGCGLGAMECSSGGGEVLLIIVAITIFVTGIFGAFVAIYRIIAKYNRRALANMKETILEVK